MAAENLGQSRLELYASVKLVVLPGKVSGSISDFRNDERVHSLLSLIGLKNTEPGPGDALSTDVSSAPDGGPSTL